MVLRLVAYNKAVEDVSSKIGSFQGHLPIKDPRRKQRGIQRKYYSF